MGKVIAEISQPRYSESQMPKRMILNLTLHLQGSITSVKEWVDTIDPSVVVRCDIVRTSSFTPCAYGDDTTCKHFKRVELKLNLPIEYDAIGHRVSPTDVLAKYIDELMYNYQYRMLNKGRKDVPELEDHETKFAHWKPNTSLPYWAAEKRDNAVLSMYDTKSYISQ